MQISIDTNTIRDSYDVDDEQIGNIIDSVTKSVTLAYAGYLEQQAKQNLHKTKNIYIRNIKLLDEGRMKGAVLLDYSKNPLVKMIEEGASAFDMKIGFEHSEKKHIKANGAGWYLTIPFREASEGSIGEADIFTSVMPEAVYEAVKQKDADIPTNTGFKSKGLTINEVPSEYRAPKTRAAVTSIITNQRFEEYKNKSSVYAGISKITDKVTGQSSYQSFRRVSDKSDPNSWIFPGMEAKHLTDNAMSDLEANLEKELNMATNEALSKIGL